MPVEPAEFGKVMCFLESVTGAPPTSADRVQAYYDLLGDLPLPLLQAAAKRAALAHRWPSLPPAGSIRQEARNLERAEVSADVAWEMVRQAVRAYGRRRPTLALDSLPRAVARAARSMGWEVLCEAKREDTLVRHQFTEAYDRLRAYDDREAELPAALRAMAKGVGELPGPARQPPILPPPPCAEVGHRPDCHSGGPDAPGSV